MTQAAGLHRGLRQRRRRTFSTSISGTLLARPAGPSPAGFLHTGGRTAGGKPDLEHRSRWIRSILAGPLQHEPGAAWSYSTAGYVMLGEIIRRVTGLSHEEAFRRILLDPLGLRHTFFTVPEQLRDRVCLINDWERTFLLRTPGPDEPPLTGGGLYSTLGDLHRFGLMLMNGGTWDGVRILGRKTVELLRRDQFPDGIYAFHWGERTRCTANRKRRPDAAWPDGTEGGAEKGQTGPLGPGLSFFRRFFGIGVQRCIMACRLRRRLHRLRRCRYGHRRHRSPDRRAAAPFRRRGAPSAPRRAGCRARRPPFFPR